MITKELCREEKESAMPNEMERGWQRRLEETKSYRDFVCMYVESNDDNLVLTS